MSILRHREDRWPVAVTYAGLALALATVAVNGRVHPVLFAALVALSFLCRVVALPHQHNHSHLPMYTAKPLNALHDFVLSVVTGYTTEGWMLQHVLGHHRLLHQPLKDPTFVGRFAPPDGTLLSRQIYMVAVEAATFWDARRIAASLPRAAGDWHRRRLWHETIRQHLVYAAVIAVNPLAGLVSFLAVNKVLRLLVVKASYDHHFHAEAPFTAASYDKLPCPWYLQNLGYHHDHHAFPRRHWSLLRPQGAKAAVQNGASPQERRA